MGYKVVSVNFHFVYLDEADKKDNFTFSLVFQ